MFNRRLLAAVLTVATIAAATAFAGPARLAGDGNRCQTHDDVLYHMHRSRQGISLTCTDADLPAAVDSVGAAR